MINMRTSRYNRYDMYEGTSVNPGTERAAIKAVANAVDILEERVFDVINEFTQAKFGAAAIGDDFDLSDLNKKDMRELAVHLKKNLSKEPFYNFSGIREAAIVAVLPFVVNNFEPESLAEILVNTVVTYPEVMGVDSSEVIDSIIDAPVKSKLKITLQLYVELCNSILEGKMIDVSYLYLDFKDLYFKSQFKHILNLLRKLV